MRLPEVTEVQRLNVQPGDRIIVRCPEKLTAEVANRVEARVRAILRLPDYVPLLVLTAGLSLEVAGMPEIVR